MEKIGLVLEGGGFRGIYTAGILDYFLDQEWHFPYVIGVSMGSCNGANYISKQRGRSIDIPYKYMGDDRYISFKNWIRKGSLFGMDYIFHEIPLTKNAYDFKTMRESDQVFKITAMDVHYGKSKFFDKDELSDSDYLKALEASCSLPYISKMVEVQGKPYLDGGLSDSIPIRKAFEDGVDKVIAIVTREKGYRKQPSKAKVGKLIYRGYPQVVNAVTNRSKHYNQEIAYMEKLAKQGKVFPIYPKEPIEMGRTERDREKLKQCYLDGYERAKELHEQIVAFAKLEEPAIVD